MTMAEDNPVDISLNIYSSPIQPEDVRKGKKTKRKIEDKITVEPASSSRRQKQSVRDETATTDQERADYTSQGRISSLFCNNPDIPMFAHRVVKPVSEPVFSSQNFKDLPIHPYTVSNLDQNLGLQMLTTVQQKALPVLLSGKDALVKSQTGSGKTLAYALPIIEALQAVRPKISRGDGVQAVVVVPTRELALQTYEWFIKLVKPFTWIVPGYLVGGEKRKSEKARLRKGITVLVGTPGRLLDHVQHTKSLLLDKVGWLVLDEADRLLDMGYEKDVASFIEALDSQRQSPHRTVLLSATLTSAVERLAGMTLQSPTFVDAASDESVSNDLVIPESLKQFYVLTPAKLRLVTLSAFIIWKCQMSDQRKMLIFCATQDMVDFHSELLALVLGSSDQVDVEFFKLHGNMSQKERTDVFKTFRAADSGVLLCTDVAARGLDLPRVDWIVQFTAPSTASDYVHRVGRTARVGTAGAALLFLTPSEVQFIRQLEDRRIRLQEETMDRCLQKLQDGRSASSVEGAATALQARFETAVLEQRGLHDMACKAYVSWVRFYASYKKEAKAAFNFKGVHLGHYAKSFALRDPPSAIGGIGRQQWQRNRSSGRHTGYTVIGLEQSPCDIVFPEMWNCLTASSNYHCKLHPIELISNLLKQRNAAKNFSSVNLSILKDMTKNYIATITPDDWLKACEHVKQIEKKYWHRNGLMEEAIENVIINVGLESSDEETDMDTNTADEGNSDTDTIRLMKEKVTRTRLIKEAMIRLTQLPKGLKPTLHVRRINLKTRKLAGLAVVALAIWMLLDPMFYASMGQDGQSYYTGVYIFLAVGVLMFIVGILGYCGDSRESPCLLLLYCCAMVIIIVSEVVAVVWAYRNRVQIEEYVRETIKITVQKEYGVLSSRTKAFDAIQEGLQCCGVNGPKDWAGSEYNMRDRGAVNLAVSSFLHVYKIPRSCCRAGLDDDICNIALRVGLGAQIVDAIYPEGCVDKVIKALKNHVNILLGIGISIVVLECLALIFSLVRCCSIRDVNKV